MKDVEVMRDGGWGRGGGNHGLWPEAVVVDWRLTEAVVVERRLTEAVVVERWL